MSSGVVAHRHLVDGTVLIVLEDHALPVVRFALATRDGALRDPQGAAGATQHLFEMLLRGTKKKPRAEFVEALEILGSGVGSYAGTETAVVRGVSLRRHLDATLALVGEALSSPGLAADEHRRLVEETCEELRSERDEDSTVAEIFLRRALYRGHPLERSPAGTLADLETLELSTIETLYRAAVRRDNLVVVFAGDLTLAEGEKALRTVLGGIAGGIDAPVVLPPPPLPQGVNILIADKPERTQVQMRLARPAVSGLERDALPFWLGIVAFGGTFTSTFTREVRDVRGWSYFAHAVYSRRSRLMSPLVMRTAPALKDAIDCLALELDLYDRLAGGELDPGSVDKAKSYLSNRYPFEISTAADLLMPVLQAELLGEGPDEVFRFPERLATIDEAQVRAALKKHLVPGNIAACLVATAADLTDTLATRLPKARIEVIDYRDGVGAGPEDDGRDADENDDEDDTDGGNNKPSGAANSRGGNELS